MAQFFGILTALLLVSVSRAMIDPSCTVVNRELTPCTTYIEGDQTTEVPSPECCAGAQQVATQVQTDQDKVALCNCVKEAVTNLLHQAVPQRVAELPKNCGLNINFPPIDANYDCSKISWQM